MATPKNQTSTTKYKSHWKIGNASDVFISSIALRIKIKILIIFFETNKFIVRVTTGHGFDYTNNYKYVNCKIRWYIIIIILSSHRLPSTMSAMDSRIRLRKNMIINSKITSATVDTMVNTSQVDFLFSLAFA